MNSLGFREGAEPISCLTLPWERRAEQLCPLLHQGVGAVGMKHLCGSGKLPGKGNPQSDGTPMFSPLLPLCQPGSISLAVTSCVFSFPAVLRLLQPLPGSGAHHKLLTPRVCRNMPHHWGVGKKRSLALCQVHTPSNSDCFPCKAATAPRKAP